MPPALKDNYRQCCVNPVPVEQSKTCPCGEQEGSAWGWLVLGASPGLIEPSSAELGALSFPTGSCQGLPRDVACSR